MLQQPPQPQVAAPALQQPPQPRVAVPALNLPHAPQDPLPPPIQQCPLTPPIMHIENPVDAMNELEDLIGPSARIGANREAAINLDEKEEDALDVIEEMVNAEQAEKKQEEKLKISNKLDILLYQSQCQLSPTSAICSFLRQNESMVAECEDAPSNLKQMVKDLKACGAIHEIHEKIKMEQMTSDKEERILKFVLWKYGNLPPGSISDINLSWQGGIGEFLAEPQSSVDLDYNGNGKDEIDQ